jgi:hypothetical protein
LLLSNALASEFEAPVPTEQLRQRIEAAVSGMQPSHTHVENVGVLAGVRKSLSDLFTFAPQRTLGYASLMIVLAFATIFGIIKWRQPKPVQSETVAGTNGRQPSVPGPTQEIAPSVNATTAVELKGRDGPQLIARPLGYVVKSPLSKPGRKNGVNNHVKLLPGEKSYLQTIAKLDTAINAGNTAMRPALQVEYQRNLAVVDRAIAATRSAAKSNPNDPDAAEFMFSAYQSKVDLLNTIADARVRSH